MNTGPIGVFDSGVGGLGILRALRRALPHEDFHYIADAAHAPYGERADAFVAQRSHALARELVQVHGAKLLVVACNTATAAAVQGLRAAWPHIPIVGVEPALRPAVARSASGRIGVMATRATLASGKFQALLAELGGQASFRLQPCDGLADAIEQDDAGCIAGLCERYLGALGIGEPEGPDTVVLGCTHYPLALDVLQSLAGPQVAFLEPGEAIARRVKHQLRTHAIARGHGEGPVTLSSTGDPATLQDAAARWLEGRVRPGDGAADRTHWGQAPFRVAMPDPGGRARVS